jgi:hypothetical protein
MKLRWTVLACTALFALAISGAAQAGDAADDGTYDAQVTTDSGTYSVPVEVEDGEVTQVHWPNGGDMNVEGGDLDGGEASGINSRGDIVNIEIDDSEYNSSPVDDE